MMIMDNAISKRFVRLIQFFKKIYSVFHSHLISIPDLTQQGVLFLGFIFIIFMISITKHDVVLFQVSIICYLVFGGAFVFSYINLIGLTSTRQTPRFVFAKESFMVKVTIENNKKSIETFWVNLEDDFYKKEHSSLLSYISIAPQSSIEKEFVTVVHRRGVYTEFSYRLTSTFPFGFFIKEKLNSENSALTVFPMAMEESELNNLLGTQSGSQGSMQTFNSDYQGEIRGMRPFMPGDPIKMIHWRASMRTSTLMVKEFEPTSSDTTLIIAHSVNLKDQRFQSRKSFEKMLQFLSGYFNHKVKDTSECYFCPSFNSYHKIQVTNDNESLYSALSLLAESKEYKERSLSKLLHCLNENHHINNIIVIGNTKKEYWAPAVFQMNSNVTCVDTVGLDFLENNI